MIIKEHIEINVKETELRTFGELSLGEFFIPPNNGVYMKTNNRDDGTGNAWCFKDEGTERIRLSEKVRTPRKVKLEVII